MHTRLQQTLHDHGGAAPFQETVPGDRDDGTRPVSQRVLPTGIPQIRPVHEKSRERERDLFETLHHSHERNREPHFRKGERGRAGQHGQLPEEEERGR